VDRQHDDRYIRIGANRSTRCQSAHPRHVDVKEHKIRPEFANLSKRLLACFRVVYFVSGSNQRSPHNAPDLRLVVNHENAA
jgi:hypothetical protein